ncbi:MAG: sugar phosphate isomerase/epimerase family protein [Luteolibacter sp.]|uniref:sugar phosphate isomerase/epimerase family protein n=1 Tax=Luteolibacter sp. TaxID=1962973 RepID=UPI0032638DA8
MKSAITISQVPEAAAGPFVLRTPLPEAFATAAAIGFDAVELFLPGPYFASVEQVKSLAAIHGLAIAAVGTGAGWLRHGLSFTDPSEEIREQALHFVLSMIDFGAHFKAPAILGSMQGKNVGPDSMEHLVAALRICAKAAAEHHVPFIYEPLNRYETNLFNRLGDAAKFLEAHDLKNVVLLADLFHMNIEEQDVATALLEAAPHVGHVHFADSNRQAMGFGHTAAAPIIAALRQIGYTGYLSAEILPLPDPETAARQTISSIRSLLES